MMNGGGEKMTEVTCIFGDSENICDMLAEKLNDGWAVMEMQTNLYDTTAGIRRDTTVYLIRNNE